MVIVSFRVLQLASCLRLIAFTFVNFSSTCAFHGSILRRVHSFPCNIIITSQLYSTSKSSKKKKNVLSPGKGFGKQQKDDEQNTPYEEINRENIYNKNNNLFVSIDDDDDTTSASASASFPLGQNPSSSSSSSSILVDRDITTAVDKPVEERTKDILRKKYGLTSMEEKLSKLEEMDRYDLNQKKSMKIEKALLLEKKKKEESSFISFIPPNILGGISTFLKLGTGISVFLFVLAGIGITWEAWIVSTKPEKNFMSPQVDTFITQVVEPNFTLGLFILLGFSISLGLLSSAQLGSSSSVYQEKE